MENKEKRGSVGLSPHRAARRPLIRVLVTLLLMVGGVVGIGGVAYADNNPIPGQWSELYLPYFNPGQFKCLDVPGGTSSQGTALQVWHCHGYASNGNPQRWYLLPRGQNLGGDTLYEIENAGNGLCVTLPAVFNVGVQVVQQPCLDTVWDNWTLTKVSDVGPYFALSSVEYPGLCLSTANSSGNDGTALISAYCDYWDHSDPTWVRQIWSLG